MTVRFGEPKPLIAVVAARIVGADADRIALELRRGLFDTVKVFVADWSRQAIDQPARSKAATSRESRILRPRLIEADRVGTGICPYWAVGCAQLIYGSKGD